MISNRIKLVGFCIITLCGLQALAPNLTIAERYTPTDAIYTFKFKVENPQKYSWNQVQAIHKKGCRYDTYTGQTSWEFTNQRNDPSIFNEACWLTLNYLEKNYDDGSGQPRDKWSESYVDCQTPAGGRVSIINDKYCSGDCTCKEPSVKPAKD